MGNILSTKLTKDNSMIFEIELDYDEALELKGSIKNVHLFSEEAAEVRTNLSQRGAKESTKYFLIPKGLRENLKFSEEVKCQKIETKENTIFIFVVDRLDED